MITRRRGNSCRTRGLVTKRRRGRKDEQKAEWATCRFDHKRRFLNWGGKKKKKSRKLRRTQRERMEEEEKKTNGCLDTEEEGLKGREVGARSEG